MMDSADFGGGLRETGCGAVVGVVDYERGKGNYRRFGKAEKPYPFISPDRLLADFGADIGRLKAMTGAGPM